MQDKTIEMLENIIDENKRLVNRIIHGLDVGDYPSVTEHISEMGNNTKELDHICYTDDYQECKDYIYNNNIPLHLEVIQKLKDKCE